MFVFQQLVVLADSELVHWHTKSALHGGKLWYCGACHFLTTWGGNTSHDTVTQWQFTALIINAYLIFGTVIDSSITDRVFMTMIFYFCKYILSYFCNNLHFSNSHFSCKLIQFFVHCQSQIIHCVTDLVCFLSKTIIKKFKRIQMYFKHCLPKSRGVSRFTFMIYLQAFHVLC